MSGCLSSESNDLAEMYAAYFGLAGRRDHFDGALPLKGGSISRNHFGGTD